MSYFMTTISNAGRFARCGRVIDLFNCLILLAVLLLPLGCDDSDSKDTNLGIGDISDDQSNEDTTSTNDQSMDASPTDQLKTSLLHGDWLVYSTDPTSPHIARAYHFWRFEVDDGRFDMYEACKDPAHSSGDLDDELLRFDGSDDRTFPISDGELHIQEVHGDATQGLSFHAMPVDDFDCETNADGRVRISNQIVQPRNVEGPVAETKYLTIADADDTATGTDDDKLLDHLRASAGTLLSPVGESTNGAVPLDPNTQPQTSESSKNVNSQTFKTTCTTTEMTQQQMSNAFTVFDTSANIFPGALIQGGPYMTENIFQQITSGAAGAPLARKRTPLTISITGPTLNQGNKIFKEIDDPSKIEKVNQAVRDILAEGVAQGELNLDSYYTLASSENQLNMDLGVAGGYEGISLSSDFSLDIESGQNHVVFYYFQKFYSVVVNDFGGALNAFAAEATDPPDPITGAYQIGAGNPPLYIKQVDYGRQFYFEVTSSFSLIDLKSTFDAAFDGMGTGVSAKIESGLEVKSVMENASIKYKIRGGSDQDAANWVVLPASGGNGSGADLFDQLKTFFAQIKAQTFTTDTPGAPIGYTLNYLVNDKPAAMLYTADFTEQSCVTDAAPVVHSYHYSLGGDKKHDISGLDDYAKVFIDGTKIHSYSSPKGDQSWSNQSLNHWLGDNKGHTLKVEIYNNGGWATGGTFELFEDSTAIFKESLHGGTGAWTGKVYEVKLDLNSNGTCKKTYEFTPGESAYNITYENKVDSCK